mmetsp:Transcript_17744/g.24531  ORF Transcript_17744/g.24531 Transcript_17744/m.24531 type:complete len:89 (-) Transcript_17744:159-425(-)|eukprot:CAMPEP_0196570352 /NCGR_PEP_ID=MMETSP1081-20130531/420_1 /TAXON_ID=36882 /ORGANISM="Pyramimonas amylifera, Strain CCMP720" /LENGTH=88 /DNA_ID=CAMNT_0041886743 /DNA_START=92 /DNA_END=358 /DNA_ORIENTATION=+
MPAGQAFDGSIWVTGLQASSIAIGGALSAVASGFLITRATNQMAEMEAQEARETSKEKTRRRRMEKGPPQKSASAEPGTPLEPLPKDV